MPRKIQLSYTKFNSKVIACLGDSLTKNQSKAVRQDVMWPSLLPGLLASVGCTVTVRNWGISGQTSAQMLARIACMYPAIGGNANALEIPDLATIWCGTNDTTFGAVADGGSTAKNIVDMCAALVAKGVRRILIISNHYQDFTVAFTAGTQRDTLTTPYAKWDSAIGATNVSLRYWQQQAAQAAQTAAGSNATIIYADIYTYMRDQIIGSGTTSYLGFPVTPSVAEGSNLWYAADGDLHLNVAGNMLVAQAIAYSIRAQSGWVTALTA